MGYHSQGPPAHARLRVSKHGKSRLGMQDMAVPGDTLPGRASGEGTHGPFVPTHEEARDQRVCGRQWKRDGGGCPAGMFCLQETGFSHPFPVTVLQINTAQAFTGLFLPQCPAQLHPWGGTGPSPPPRTPHDPPAALAWASNASSHSIPNHTCPASLWDAFGTSVCCTTAGRSPSRSTDGQT